MEKLKLIFILCTCPETDDYSPAGYTSSTLYFSSRGMVTFAVNRNDRPQVSNVQSLTTALHISM